ncbi:MAG: hypothetical protein ABSH48_05835 [Verrucomicrobiota bacterium]|jgi:hypothetical protein
MKTKSFCFVALIALACVVIASLGLSFTSQGAPIVFLGIHIATADIEFIPPAAGALALVGGIVLLLIKFKRT